MLALASASVRAGASKTLRLADRIAGVRPIYLFWISEGLTQAQSYFKGWNSQVHREFPKDFESRNLRKDNLSREIGRTEFKVGAAFTFSSTAHAWRTRLSTAGDTHDAGEDASPKSSWVRWWALRMAPSCEGCPSRLCLELVDSQHLPAFTQCPHLFASDSPHTYAPMLVLHLCIICICCIYVSTLLLCESGLSVPRLQDSPHGSR